MAQKILVVDDSKTYLVFALHALKNAGFTVLQSEDIWITQLVKRERPDLILMDVTLGVVMQGTNAVRALKKCSFCEGIKIVLHSSEPAEKLEELYIGCGADGYITKDGEAETLVKKVKEALSTAHYKRAIG